MGSRGGFHQAHSDFLDEFPTKSGSKQTLIALATTHDGDVPLFLQPLEGNSNDKVSLLAAITMK